MALPTLLLWDIDGTLLTTDKAGERAILRAVQDHFGRDIGPKLPVDLRGRTDTSIARDLFAHMGQEGDTAAHIEEHLRFLEIYLSHLPHTLAAGKARLQPGFPHLLDRVAAHPEIHQALLTGNLQRGAEIKLSHLGLWKYFEFGAFANDSHIRNELGPFALRRAKEKLGIEFAPERVFIIGDTPHDVACGKIIGAKTIAVATGAFTVEELAACSPTHTLPDLSDAELFLSLVTD